MTDLLGELKALRKGYGLDDPRALSRIGPELRLAAGVAEGDDAAATRAKVTAFLRDTAATLPWMEARAVAAAFALDGSEDRRLEERLRRLGARMGCDMRTVKRRLDAALQKVVERTCASMPAEDVASVADPWHLDRVEADVRLDSACTEVREGRRVVSHRDGLREVAFSYSVPPHVRTSVEVLQGGARATSDRCSATRTRIRVWLPHPLKRSETHEVTLRVVTATAVPVYVCTPRSRCARFDLTVGFRDGCVPRRLWLVRDELPLEAGDPERARVRVPIDADGRATASFTSLVSNRSYGLAWSSA